MTAYLEHANLTVPDIDAAVEFLRAVEPRFEVRRDEISPRGYRWAHVGTDTSYVALQAPHLDSNARPPLPGYKNYGVNHLAWVVDDFEAVVQRLEQHGYERGLPVAPEKFRKRAYFYDTAGFEWEIVQYLSDDPAERNLYE